MNGLTHPGEKRLVQLCREGCALLPADFEENLNQLFADLFARPAAVGDDLSRIIRQLEQILP